MGIHAEASYTTDLSTGNTLSRLSVPTMLQSSTKE